MPQLPASLAVLQGAAQLPSAAGRLGGSAGPDLTRYFIVCALLLAGIAALAFGFRRLVGRSLAARAARRSLQVMDVLPMGGKHRLAVVRCYDRTFLLGLGEREVSLVAELDGAIAPEREPAATEADQKAFADLLSRVRPKAPPSRRGVAEREAAPRPSPAARPGLGAGVLG